MDVAIVDWGTRPDFLLRRLFPDAEITAADPLVDLDEILAAALESARGCLPRSVLWVLHLNISRWEKWWYLRDRALAQLRAKGCRLVNGRVSDVRKTAIQSLNVELELPAVQVGRNDDPATRVIVKTDYNYGGMLESRLSPAEAERLGLLSNEGPPVRTYDAYRVCKQGEVSEAEWRDERLVVERFVENDSDRFCRFYRCGHRAVLSEAVNRDAVKKMRPGLPRRNWFLTFGGDCPRTHERMVRNATTLCEHMGLDFGAVDIVIDRDDCPYVIDVNPTPGWGEEEQGEVLDFLRAGFDGSRRCAAAGGAAGSIC